MIDKRVIKLAKLIVGYSLNIKKGEKVFVIGNEVAKEFIALLSKEIIKKKAFIIPAVLPRKFEYNLIKRGNKKEIVEHRDDLMKIAKQADAVIDIENEPNDYSILPAQKLKDYGKIMKPLWDFLIFSRGKRRRTTLLLPFEKEAKDAGWPLKKFEDFVYSCSLINWAKLSGKFQKINELFEKGEKVKLMGKGVNLEFSIKGRNSILENGKENIPGGELYIAPVRTSLNGWIKFDYPAIRDGLEIGGIYLKFKNGKVVSFSAQKNQKHLRALLNTDSGSRYVGEFGIGINPKAKEATKSWIDEKIEGTIHLALGKSYDANVKKREEANNSAIHWDIVKDMKKAEIILDGQIVQKKGKWKMPPA